MRFFSPAARNRSVAAGVARVGIVLAGLLPAHAQAGLWLEPRLRETSLTDPSPRPAFIRAEQIQGRIEREIEMRGQAEFRQGGTVVRADRLTRYESDDELVAVGDVRVSRNGQFIQGPRLQLSLDAQQGRMESPRFNLPETGASGKGRLLEFIDRHRMRLSEASYTVCRPDDPDWILRAHQLTLDDTANEGEVKGARFYFRDVPVLSLPWLAFGLGDGRRSGFLAPSLSQSNRLGAEVRLPYYWNIAPNRDLLWSANLSSRRGLQIAGTARTLDQIGQSTTQFEVNPRDPLAGSSRWLVNSLGSLDDLSGWSGGWTLRGVSDDTYFVDYARNIAQSADRSLPRSAFLARGWGDWTLRIGVLQHQNILEARQAPAYDRLPQFTLNHSHRDPGGLDLQTAVDLSQFRRPLAGSAEGWRLTAHPSAAYTVGGPAWFVTPRAGVRMASYQLNNNPVGPPDLQLAVPSFSLDAGMVFERPAVLGGQKMIQTLEPRLFYVRTPYRDQSSIPVFDSSVVNLSFATLFSDNVFAGGDRVADANQLTAGAVSRFVSAETGAETLRLALAQRFYFTPQQVGLPGVPLRADPRSDILMAASGGISQHQSIDAAVQFSLNEGALPRASLSWRWWPAPERLLNVALRYQSRDYAQIDTSWRWPVASGWSSLGRLNYSLLREQLDSATGQLRSVSPNMIESLIGFEYQTDCWGARFVAQRFLTTTAIRTTSIFLQFEFTGFARLGIDPLDILARGIPGYRPLPARPIQPSRFHGHE